MWPMQGAPGQTSQASAVPTGKEGEQKKKKKKEKKEKQEGGVTATGNARPDVGTLQAQIKALEIKLVESGLELQNTRAELETERGTKTTLAKELSIARSELRELRAGAILEAADIQAELEAAWTPIIETLEARLRTAAQEHRAAVRNVEDRDARIQKLGETLAARAVQIGSLSKARESLLTTISRMKQKMAVMRVQNQEVQPALGSAPSDAQANEGAPVTGTSTSSSSTTAAEPKAGGTATTRAVPRAHAKVPAGPLPHRTMSSPSSVLRKSRTVRNQASEEGGEANGKGPDATQAHSHHISFAEGEALQAMYEIDSYKDLGKQLWVQKPGTKVYCDQCFRRVPQARGNLQQDPTRSQFSQERFLCEECNSAAVALSGAVGDGQVANNGEAANHSAAESMKSVKLVSKRRVVSRSRGEANAQNGTTGVATASTASPSAASGAAQAALDAGAQASSTQSTDAANDPVPPGAPLASSASVSNGAGAASATTTPTADVAADSKPSPVAASSGPSFAETLTEKSRAASQAQS